MTLIRGYLDGRRLGVVRGSRYPMRLDAKWSPEPDLLVVWEAKRHLLRPNRLEGVADLVIEIASESDPGLDLREKLPRYRDAGIDEIWLVNPFERSLRAETKQLAGYTSRTLTSGRLESTVVTGFWLEVSWLWRDELPSTLDCLCDMLGSL